MAAAIMFAAGVFPVEAASSRLSGKTLQRDLTRYHKLVNQKKLSLDDRITQLLNIENKYRRSKVSLAPVRNEIEQLKKKYAYHIASDAPPPAKGMDAGSESKAEAPVISSSSPAVENISIMDSSGDSQVIVTARGVRHSNYFLLRGPDKDTMPAVALDIYGVTLINTVTTVRSAKGAFSEASVHLLRDKPEPVVRVIAHMREARQYRVEKEGSDRWVIIIEKKAPAVIISTSPRVSADTNELVPEVLAVPVSELPVEMKPIETPAPVKPAGAAEPEKKITTQTPGTRTQLEQALPWASLATLFIIIAISI